MFFMLKDISINLKNLWICFQTYSNGTATTTTMHPSAHINGSFFLLQGYIGVERLLVVQGLGTALEVFLPLRSQEILLCVKKVRFIGHLS